MSRFLTISIQNLFCPLSKFLLLHLNLILSLFLFLIHPILLQPPFIPCKQGQNMVSTNPRSLTPLPQHQHVSHHLHQNQLILLRPYMIQIGNLQWWMNIKLLWSIRFRVWCLIKQEWMWLRINGCFELNTNQMEPFKDIKRGWWQRVFNKHLI